MPTKLLKKLSYLKETKNKIQKALEDKGAHILPTDTFRSFSDKILNLPTQSLKTYMPTDFQPVADKNMILYDLGPDFMDNKTQTLSGSFEARFDTNASAFSFIRGDYFISSNETSSNNLWTAYKIGNKEGLPYLSPAFTTKENTYCGKFILNPNKNDVFSTGYFLPTEETFPSGVMSYPEGGVYTDFANAMSTLFDSSGEYLLQANSNGSYQVDVLRLKQDETSGAYSYDFVTTLVPPTTSSTYYLMPADYRCKNTFCVSGKYIYTIRKDETGAETFNYFDVLPKIGVVSSGSVIYYGKNWLIVRASTSASSNFYFIKATPLDETLASQDDGFYDNPDQYTYQIIHTQSGVSLPSEHLLKHHQNGYVSLRNFTLSYYFKALKEKIEDISDFEYNLSSRDLESAKGTLLSPDVFLAASFVEGSGNSTTTRAFPSIFYKNKESATPIFLRDKTFFCYPWHYFSEYGYGYYYSSGYYYYYYIIGREFSSSIYTNYAGPWDIYMKNGLMSASLNGNYFQYAYLLTDRSRIDVSNYMSSIVDEDIIGYLRGNYIIRFGDKFGLNYYAPKNMSFKKASQIVMKYQGDIIILDFQDKVGDEIDGALYTVTFDEENKTFNATFVKDIKGSFSSNQTGLLKRVKQKNFFITKNKLYGLYTGHNDGILRFVERDLPVEVRTKINDATIQYTQTLYDGTISFILSDGRTLIADILFNEQTGEATLRPGTGIQTLDPVAPELGVRYQLLSPFKKYVYIFDPDKIMSKIEYFRKVLNPAEWNLIPQGQDNKPHNSSGDALDYMPESAVMRNALGDESYQGFLRENTKTLYQTYNHSVFMTGKKALSPAGYILTEIDWRPWQN